MDGAYPAAARPPAASLTLRSLLAGLAAALLVAAAVWLGVVGGVDVPEPRDYRFSRGTTFAPGEAERLRADLVDLAKEPRRVIRIVGHTGSGGIEAENLRLSRERADAVREMALQSGFAPERITFAGGVGSADPADRADTASEREYQRRLSRVTVESGLAR